MSIKTTPLFGPLTPDAMTALAEYRHVLEKGFPMSPRHKKSLGQNIKLLSHMLTDERDTLKPGISERGRTAISLSALFSAMEHLPVHQTLSRA